MFNRYFIKNIINFFKVQFHCLKNIFKGHRMLEAWDSSKYWVGCDSCKYTPCKKSLDEFWRD